MCSPDLRDRLRPSAAGIGGRHGSPGGRRPGLRRLAALALRATTGGPQLVDMEKATDVKKLFDQNIAAIYAVTRNALYDKGKKIEILANFHPKLHYIGEWWKQLYGESEGKDHKGIFPASVDLTTDLHSMGQ